MFCEFLNLCYVICLACVLRRLRLCYVRLLACLLCRFSMWYVNLLACAMCSVSLCCVQSTASGRPVRAHENCPRLVVLDRSDWPAGQVGQAAWPAWPARLAGQVVYIHTLACPAWQAMLARRASMAGLP